MATSDRGFASMDPAKQREIASKGGKASHSGGRTNRSSTATGAAGKTTAAKQGGMNSRRS